jgi:hypothetical protein
MPANGSSALGWSRGKNQMKTLIFENRQVIIDGFNQYQNGCGHAALL